jgi:DUF971 family protein
MSPTEIHVAADRGQLEIAWPDGTRSRLTATTLRLNARSADALRQQLDGSVPPSVDDIRIHSVNLIGNYAINLSFSDGHDRGIYPWSHLRALAAAGDAQPHEVSR